MRRLQRVAAALMTMAGSAVVFAQTPAPSPAPANRGTQAVTPATPNPARKSIVHHYPYPYPSYYHGDQSAGYRNPGHQGRYLEYYPPGNQFQENKDPVRPARFDTSFGNRSEQLASQQVGISRYNSIQGHIDNYARPMMGVGFFGGFY